MFLDKVSYVALAGCPGPSLSQLRWPQSPRDLPVFLPPKLQMALDTMPRGLSLSLFFKKTNLAFLTFQGSGSQFFWL